MINELFGLDTRNPVALHHNPVHSGSIPACSFMIAALPDTLFRMSVIESRAKAIRDIAVCFVFGLSHI